MAEKAPGTPEPVAQEGESFIVVDHDVPSQELMREVLTQRNPTSVTTVDSSSALFRFLDSQPWNWTPSMVFVDLVLPAVSGYDVIRRLRERYGRRQIPIVVVSSLSTTEDVIEAQVAGATAFVKKPLKPELIDRAFEYCRSEGQKPLGERKGTITVIS